MDGALWAQNTTAMMKQALSYPQFVLPPSIKTCCINFSSRRFRKRIVKEMSLNEVVLNLHSPMWLGDFLSEASEPSEPSSDRCTVAAREGRPTPARRPERTVVRQHRAAPWLHRAGWAGLPRGPAWPGVATARRLLDARRSRAQRAGARPTATDGTASSRRAGVGWGGMGAHAGRRTVWQGREHPALPPAALSENAATEGRKREGKRWKDRKNT